MCVGGQRICTDKETLIDVLVDINIVWTLVTYLKVHRGFRIQEREMEKEMGLACKDQEAIAYHVDRTLPQREES